MAILHYMGNIATFRLHICQAMWTTYFCSPSFARLQEIQEWQLILLGGTQVLSKSVTELAQRSVSGPYLASMVGESHRLLTSGKFARRNPHGRAVSARPRHVLALMG